MDIKKDAAQQAITASGIRRGDRYRHFKGGEYEIVELAIYEETLTPLVVYMNREKGMVWARTLENFTQDVEYNGKTVKRFTRVA
jgi:hypothetical protein